MSQLEDLQTRIVKLRVEIAERIRRGYLEDAARLEYGVLPKLEEELKRLLNSEYADAAGKTELDVASQFLTIIWPGWVKDPEMAETPQRLLDAWREMLSGDGDYDDWKTFDTIYTGIITRVGVPVNATCAHHMLAYTGVIDFAYIPDGKKLGISKIVRWLRHRCRVPSSQEELTERLVREFMERVKPQGAMLRFRAFHSCESLRGVSIAGVETGTESVRGAFQDNPMTRQEALSLFDGGRNRDG